METVVTDSGLELSIRWMLAVVFASALIHKLRSPSAFAATVDAYRILPSSLISLTAYSLIAAEIFTTAMLLVNSRVGSAMAAVMLGIYSVAILVNIVRGRRDIDCGCSGPNMRQPLTSWLLMRNILLILLAFVSMLPALAPRPLSLIDWFVSIAAAVVFALVYFSANQISVVRSRFGR